MRRIIGSFLVAVLAILPPMLYFAQATNAQVPLGTPSGGMTFAGGSGTVGATTGSGTSGQVALWNGTSTLTGDTGLTYIGTGATLQIRLNSGTSSAPAVAIGANTTGIYSDGGGLPTVTVGNTASLNIATSRILIPSASGYCINSAALGGGGPDICATRSAAGVMAVGTSTIGDATGEIRTQRYRVGGTAPTCSSNCGTSPSVVGSDSAGIVTMGGTGSPASGWVLTFAGTWAAAPACVMNMALTGMANTKLPLTVVTTTTTITVVTNGAAPANSDKYAYQCIGVQ